jgi:TRAP-type C4-dicarboxylate transport system substrate-binding protein
LCREQAQEALADLKKAGMQVNDVPAAEIQRMQQKTRPVKDKILAEYDQQTVKSFLDALDKAK